MLVNQVVKVHMALIPIAILIAVGFLYVWYLRLAGKWMLKTWVSKKLCWIFVGIVLVVSVINVGIGNFIGRPSFMAVGVAIQLLFGAWYFGKFALNAQKAAPGFVGGLKMTVVAMALLGGTSAVFIALPALILPRLS